MKDVTGEGPVPPGEVRRHDRIIAFLGAGLGGYCCAGSSTRWRRLPSASRVRHRLRGDSQACGKKIATIAIARKLLANARPPRATAPGGHRRRSKPGAWPELREGTHPGLEYGAIMQGERN